MNYATVIKIGFIIKQKNRYRESMFDITLFNDYILRFSEKEKWRYK